MISNGMVMMIIINAENRDNKRQVLDHFAIFVTVLVQEVTVRNKVSNGTWITRNVSNL